MNSPTIKLQFCLLVSLTLIITGCAQKQGEVERPEKILSKREVVYDIETYKELADLWEKYYREFPSEDAYANWMYAVRYAGLPDYENLLNKGLQEYPANPTLLYLSGNLKHGAHNNREGLHMLQRAARLDPTFVDPWFSMIIHFMDSNDDEQVNVALKKILDSGRIKDEIMDYSYNMLSGLEKDAILITNGDNDTYPGWILTRILKYRPDVKIVNRSLLNTDWYPIYLINHGLPGFTTPTGLDELRNNILEKIKSKEISMPSTGPFSDTLITKLIRSAESEGKPVYFATTLYISDKIKSYAENGRELGLVCLVTRSQETYQAQLQQITNTWLNKFRKDGLTSWRLKYANTADAGKMLMFNYAVGLSNLAESSSSFDKGNILLLFNWYKKYLIPLLPVDRMDEINERWCKLSEIKEINDWCKKMGYSE